ncbi:MAG: hypothetical protein JEZ08_04140 [Clostridiales bacterium]|nr:hypothetical protein [Clostridiales bacterium]
MLKDIHDFYEVSDGFESKYTTLDCNFSSLECLVKAHEKEIYNYSDELIVAKIHRDNKGDYPFSKLDFLSHKLLELVYPKNVPKLMAASFENQDLPYYILEKIQLDELHKAYNISRQRVHQNSGECYNYSSSFLDVDKDNVERLAEEHFQKVNHMQIKYADNLKTYGITFDHSQVNITWRKDIPIALEVHKCQRDYLFDYKRCFEYFNGLSITDDRRNKGLDLLNRIQELKFCKYN